MKKTVNPYKYTSAILGLAVIVLLVIYWVNPECKWRRVDQNSIDELVEYALSNGSSSHFDDAQNRIDSLLSHIDSKGMYRLINKVSTLIPDSLAQYHLLAQIYGNGLEWGRSHVSQAKGFYNKRDGSIYEKSKEGMEKITDGYVSMLSKRYTAKDWLKFKEYMPEEYWTSDAYNNVEQAEIDTYWTPEDKGWEEANRLDSIEYDDKFAEYQLIMDSYTTTYSKSSLELGGWEDAISLYPDAKVWMRIDGEDYEIPIAKVEETLSNGGELVDAARVHKERVNKIDKLKRYLRYYPNAVHTDEARNLMIKLTVADIMDTQHGRLPKAKNSGQSYGIESTVHVKNDTEYGLTIYYSGPIQREVVLTAYGSSNITLPNGEYYVAVRADSDGVSDYAGLDNYNGGKFDISYYIQKPYSWKSPSATYNYSTGHFDINY